MQSKAFAEETFQGLLPAPLTEKAAANTSSLEHPRLEHCYKEVATIFSICLDCDHVHSEFLSKGLTFHFVRPFLSV